MALTTCRECGAEISKSAKTCPKCGAKRRPRMHPVALGCVGVVAAFVALMVGSTVIRWDEISEKADASREARAQAEALVAEAAAEQEAAALAAEQEARVTPEGQAAFAFGVWSEEGQSGVQLLEETERGHRLVYRHHLIGFFVSAKDEVELAIKNAIPALYDGGYAFDDVHIEVEVTGRNKLGHAVWMPVAEFDFDRDLAASVNWSGVRPEDVMRLGRNFIEHNRLSDD